MIEYKLLATSVRTIAWKYRTNEVLAKTTPVSIKLADAEGFIFKLNAIHEECDWS